MLKRLTIERFKSLRKVTVDFPLFTVLFGPNAAGKSNLLDAVQALSRIGTGRTLAEALAEPIRGYPIEAFAFPSGGLPELLGGSKATFVLDAQLDVNKEAYQYRVAVDIQPSAGSLSVSDEYLAALTKRGEPKGNPYIEAVGGQLRIRRKSKPAHPRHDDMGLNHTLLSDPRLGGIEYKGIERVRTELSGWRTYYLDPRRAMRSARPPADVRDIGVLGDDIAPFLYRLHAEKPKHFSAVKRTLRSLVPSVEELVVDLDKRIGTLDIQIRQDGTDFSSRIVSEGTLRVLALCAIAVNPWGGSLLAFEEPENGVHPRRLELIVKLLSSLALDHGRQLVVTTHSPLFCNSVLKLSREDPTRVKLLRVRRSATGTDVRPFEAVGPLFSDQEIEHALTEANEAMLFESLMLRGLLDD